MVVDDVDGAEPGTGLRPPAALCDLCQQQPSLMTFRTGNYTAGTKLVCRGDNLFQKPGCHVDSLTSSGDFHKIPGVPIHILGEARRLNHNSASCDGEERLECFLEAVHENLHVIRHRRMKGGCPFCPVRSDAEKGVFHQLTVRFAQAIESGEEGVDFLPGFLCGGLQAASEVGNMRLLCRRESGRIREGDRIDVLFVEGASIRSKPRTDHENEIEGKQGVWQQVDQ